VHSAVGGDAGHVAELIMFMATLTPQDRAAIARASEPSTCSAQHRATTRVTKPCVCYLLDEFGWVMAKATEIGNRFSSSIEFLKQGSMSCFFFKDKETP
jgi:hypothetical protein